MFGRLTACIILFLITAPIAVSVVSTTYEAQFASETVGLKTKNTYTFNGQGGDAEICSVTVPHIECLDKFTLENMDNDSMSYEFNSLVITLPSCVRFVQIEISYPRHVANPEAITTIKLSDNSTLEFSGYEFDCRTTSLQNIQNDVCLMPKDVGGDCKEKVKYYYYDNNTGCCEPFEYGGCRGNDNRFRDKATCENWCMNYIKHMRVDFGNALCNDGCQAKRYYFDSSTSTCKDFLYKGCGGNDNRFMSQAECMKRVFQQEKIFECPSVTCSTHCPFGRRRLESGCFSCSCFYPCEYCTSCAQDDKCLEKKQQMCVGDLCEDAFYGKCYKIDTLTCSFHQYSANNIEGKCAVNTICEDTDNGVVCKCKDGYSGSPYKANNGKCVPIVVNECDENDLEIDSYCYSYHSRKLTWRDALQQCSRRLLGSLVSIFNSNIRTALIGNHTEGGDVWIGYNDLYRNGMFLWKDGDQSKWFTSFEKGDEKDCGYLAQEIYYNLAMGSCEKPHNFICQYPKQFICSTGWSSNYHGSECYLIIVEFQLTYIEAEMFCNDLGGTVIQIHSIGKKEEIKKLLPNDSPFWSNFPDDEGECTTFTRDSLLATSTRCENKNQVACQKTIEVAQCPYTTVQENCCKVTTEYRSKSDLAASCTESGLKLSDIPNFLNASLKIGRDVVNIFEALHEDKFESIAYPVKFFTKSGCYAVSADGILTESQCSEEAHALCCYAFKGAAAAAASKCSTDADCDGSAGCIGEKCQCQNSKLGSGVQGKPCKAEDKCTIPAICAENAICSDGTAVQVTCTCIDGYVGDGKHSCTLYNACKKESDCNANAECGEGVCECDEGYRGNGKECVEINECEEGTDDCGNFTICKNKTPYFECECMEGYERRRSRDKFCVEMPRNCHDRTLRFNNKPGKIYIDVDGPNGPLAPLRVKCSYKGDAAITIIPVKSQPSRCNGPNEMDIVYVDSNKAVVSKEHYLKLIEDSDFCSQIVTTECDSAASFTGNIGLKDGQGRDMNGFDTNNSGKCPCALGEINFCDRFNNETNLVCMCDSKLKIKEHAHFTDKSILPISQYSRSQRGCPKLLLQPLMCANEQFGIPTTCAETDIKYGVIKIDPDGPKGLGKPFYAQCTKLGSDVVTAVSPKPTDEIPDENNCEEKEMEYMADDENLESLVEQSEFCQQEWRRPCTQEPFVGATYLNRNGSSEKPVPCYCQIIERCEEEECHCENALIIDKDELPVKRVTYCGQKQTNPNKPITEEDRPRFRSLVCGPSQKTIPESCYHYRRNGHRNNGAKIIDPDMEGVSASPIVVYCDFNPICLGANTEVTVKPKDPSQAIKDVGVGRIFIEFIYLGADAASLDILRHRVHYNRIDIQIQSITSVANPQPSEIIKAEDENHYCTYGRVSDENSANGDCSRLPLDRNVTETVSIFRTSQLVELTLSAPSSLKVIVAQLYATFFSDYHHCYRHEAVLNINPVIDSLFIEEDYGKCRVVDPDRDDPLPNFMATCEFNRMVIAPGSPIRDPDDNDCNVIEYPEATIAQLKMVAYRSTVCVQYVETYARRAKVFFDNVTQTAYVKDVSGKVLAGLGGNANGKYCACGEISRCTDDTSGLDETRCYSDLQAVRNDKRDSDYFVQKEVLPITSTCTKKPPGASERPFIKLYDLHCYATYLTEKGYRESSRDMGLPLDCQRGLCFKKKQKHYILYKRLRFDDEISQSKIDPDFSDDADSGNLDPFFVECRANYAMNYAETVVYHENSYIDLSVENDVFIKFKAASHDQIRALRRVSSYCYHEVEITCSSTGIDFATEGFYDIDDNLIRFFAGGSPDEVCEGGVCNCGTGNGQSDSGRYTFPLSRVKVAATSGIIRIGPLRCSNLPRNCHEAKMNYDPLQSCPQSFKGNRVRITIDPDGAGRQEPFVANCNFKHKEDAHISSVDLDSTKVEGSGSLNWNLGSAAASVAQLRALVVSSAFCFMSVKYECRQSRTINNNNPLIGRLLDYLGNPLTFWAGADTQGKGFVGCACSLLYTCEEGYNCHCDANGEGIEQGLVLNMDLLPITGAIFDDVGYGKLTMSTLYCAQKPFGFYISCQEVHDLDLPSGEYRILPMNQGRVSLVYCDTHSQPGVGILIVKHRKSSQKITFTDDETFDYPNDDEDINLYVNVFKCYQKTWIAVFERAFTNFITWRNFAGNLRTNWGTSSGSYCQCSSGRQNECANQEYVCSNDAMYVGDDVANFDGGYLQEDDLPIRSIHSSILGLPITIKVGPLQCVNPNKNLLIDECEEGYSDCDPDATCVDTDTSFTCRCDKEGFYGRGRDCKDIDECDTSLTPPNGKHKCPDTSTCINTPGGYDCECAEGYRKSYTQNGLVVCDNRNECEEPRDSEHADKCDENANCVDTVGSYACVCKYGYYGNGTSCFPMGQCMTWGNIHYLTFDKQFYDFQGRCEYKLAGTCSESTANRDFDVFVTTVKTDSSEGLVPNSEVSVTQGLTVNMYADNSVIKIIGSRVTYNDQFVSIKVPKILSNTTQLSFDGTDIKLVYMLSIEKFLIVCFDGIDRINVYVSDFYKSKMCGLCADFDGDISNDLSDPFDVNSVTAFGDSQGVGSCASNPGPENPCKNNNRAHRTARETCTSKLKILTDRGCAREGVVNVTAFIRSCIYDMCVVGERGMCRSLDIYASECRRYNFELLIGWRANEVCPKTCKGNSVFSECFMQSTVKYCHLLDPVVIPNQPCIEGCVCPVGMVWENDTCIEEGDCGCYWPNNPITEDSLYYYGNEVRYESNCGKQCTCINGGSWECQDEVCDEVNGYCEVSNQQCICNDGYKLEVVEINGTVYHNCEDINECDDEPCHKDAVCNNTIGSYTCKCKNGFYGNGTSCEDINECNDLACEGVDDGCIEESAIPDGSNTTCPYNSTCKNSPGSYICECDRGYVNTAALTPADKPFTYKNGSCTDIDECLEEYDNCKNESTICVNTDGSFRCDCRNGYVRTISDDDNECSNDNECESGHNCGENATCIDLDPGYDCKCITGYQFIDYNPLTDSRIGKDCGDINECQNTTVKFCHKYANCTNTIGSYECECIDGFRGNGTQCEEINECENSTICNGVGNICNNTVGGYNCTCKEGFKLIAKDTCEDIDECTEETDNCDDEHGNCTNTIGSFSCSCPEGYTSIANGQVCENDNECEEPGTCGRNTICTDLTGGYKCDCKSGYVFAEDNFNCIDDDECATGNYRCPLYSECENEIGGYNCLCESGYSGHCADCRDIDECEYKLDNCKGGYCKNLLGSFMCVCDEGYKLYFDSICINENECTLGTFDCGENTYCVDTQGGYNCLCNMGYTEIDGKCVDFNECDNTPCSSIEKCENTDGSFYCDCADGYTFNESTNACRETDECAGDSTCDPDFGTCTNVNPGPGVKCGCIEGYYLHPNNSCSDIDECLENPCDTNAECENTLASYICECRNGYRGDAYTEGGCTSTDQCTKLEVDCLVGICLNTYSSYECICEEGYINIDENPRAACIKDDECDVNKLFDCPVYAVCRDDLAPYAKCECEEGAEFNENGTECVDINECNEGEDMCEDDEACYNYDVMETNKTYTCYTPRDRGDPVDDCVEECPDRSNCRIRRGNEFCKCEKGLERVEDENGDLVSCTDINECDTPETCQDVLVYCELDRGCPESYPNATCENTDPDYKCVCPNGYETLEFAQTVTCNAIDACDVEELKPECGVDALCVPTGPATATCECPTTFKGDPFSQCIDPESKCYFHNESSTFCGPTRFCNNSGTPEERCECEEGYVEVNVAEPCKDINECSGESESPCHGFANCTNSEGGFTCECEEGYVGDGFFCEPEQPCDRDPPPCGENAECEPGEGVEFSCECEVGYDGNPFDECTNIDECLTNPQACDSNATCEDTLGSYVCVCFSGFEMNDDDKCVDIDECASDSLSNCPPDNSQCLNYPGGRTCVCDEGYQEAYDEDGPKCIDINECIVSPFPDLTRQDDCAEDAVCSNTAGGYNCTCKEGFSGDGFSCVEDPCTESDFCCPSGFKKLDNTCVDIDECQNSQTPCHDHAVCKNTNGSYECECGPGYKGTGKTCDSVCTHDTCTGSMTCTVKMPENTPVCECVCHPEDQCNLKGAVCGNDGKTYTGRLQLKMQSCSHPDLQLDYDGPCKTTCEDFDCEKYSSCQITSLGGVNKATCVCDVCSNALIPVCGSDGKTYESECELNRQNCLTKSDVEKVEDNACSEDCILSSWDEWSKCSSPCGLSRRQRRRHVERQALGNGVNCPTVDEQGIQDQFEDCNFGPCPSDPCYNVSADYCKEWGQVCEREGDKAVCKCQSCDGIRDNQRVCGTDDEMYPNICSMKKASCEKKTRINVDTECLGEQHEPLKCGPVKHLESMDVNGCRMPYDAGKCVGGCGKNLGYCCQPSSMVDLVVGNAECGYETVKVIDQCKCTENEQVGEEIF